MRPRISDGIVLAAAVSILAAISLSKLPSNQLWKPDAPPHAAWCAVGELPAFRFGFDALDRATGSLMGVPTECEHGVPLSSDTAQATTTGVAVYTWCSNTPSFARGQEHWALTPGGLEHWIGDAPHVQPTVRVPDLRRPCPR